MATFQYSVIDQLGKRKRGTTSAATARQAREQLRAEGFRVESIKARRKRTSSLSTLGRSRRYRSLVTETIRELATLLQAGIPLVTALGSVTEQARGPYRDILATVRDRVASGSGLAETLSQEDGVFDETTIGMIRVGEHAGNLDEVCEQVASFRERSGELRNRVASALLYPAIVLMISIGVSVFLMTVVVPMLLANLVELGRPLPLPTRVLQVLSAALIDYGALIAGVVAIVSFGMAIFIQSPTGRNLMERVALSTPILGTLIQKQVLSRNCLILSSLLRSGVELVDAIRIAERSTDHRMMGDGLRDVRRDLESGRDLKTATLSHPLFTHSFRQVFILGQQSGHLDMMLERLGNDYDRQAERLAGRLTTVVEPILILTLSVIVGFILFATVLPILEAGNVMGE